MMTGLIDNDKKKQTWIDKNRETEQMKVDKSEHKQ